MNPQTNRKELTMTKQLAQEMALYADPADPWGSAVNALFDIAESLHWHHGEDVPAHWEFSPGMSRPDPEGFAEVCDEASPSDLIAYGNTLIRIRDVLEAKGYSY